MQAKLTGSRAMKLPANKPSACMLGVVGVLDQSIAFGKDNLSLMRQQPKLKITGSSSKFGITWSQLKSRKSAVDIHKAQAEHAVLTGCSDLTVWKSSDCVVQSNDSV